MTHVIPGIVWRESGGFTSAMVDFLYDDLDPFFPVAASEGDDQTENEELYNGTVPGQVYSCN